ncbi:MAG TPA: hypothetical protein VF614_16175 [Chthoniobacteraceae bacterium]|jgi:hypothetical protein
MSDRNIVFDCSYCATVRTYRRPPLDHRLHLCLTIMTFGLWLPFYLIGLAKRFRMPGSCPTCGKKPKPSARRLMTRVGLRQSLEY